MQATTVKNAIVETLLPAEREDEKFIATIYRWYLRGLPAKLALRKCRVDAEINKNMRPTSES